MKKNLTKKDMLDEIEDAKKRNGGKISKAELMALFTKGDLSPEEMKEIAKQNGIKLSKEDIVMIAQMKKRDLK